MINNNIKTLVSELVEEKLAELLGDPDVNYELKEEIVSRLKNSIELEKKGEIGLPTKEFVKKFGLKW